MSTKLVSEKSSPKASERSFAQSIGEKSSMNSTLLLLLTLMPHLLRYPISDAVNLSILKLNGSGKDFFAVRAAIKSS